ncbi:MAG: DUF2798 domain-containing protein [Candidatus Gracilibacteria bacterium]
MFKGKTESIIRIFFLTLFMTAIVTYWKIGYDSNYFINWMKTWGMVALIAYISMCFIISPFILDSLKLEGKKRQVIGMFLLIIIFTFVFSYRFDSLDIFTLAKNFGILTVIVFPVGMLLAGPIANVLAKKLIK